MEDKKCFEEFDKGWQDKHNRWEDELINHRRELENWDDKRKKYHVPPPKEKKIDAGPLKLFYKTKFFCPCCNKEIFWETLLKRGSYHRVVCVCVDCEYAILGYR